MTINAALYDDRPSRRKVDDGTDAFSRESTKRKMKRSKMKMFAMNTNIKYDIVCSSSPQTDMTVICKFWKIV